MTAKIDIFSGFLGAGKTMLIKKLLNENAYEGNNVILENEFGEVSIDGELLKNDRILIKEISAGCICCAVNGSFSSTLIEILNTYNPDNIIIEPSGIAKLSEVLNTLNEIKFCGRIEINNIITLIDINNFNYYLQNFKEFYTDQIKSAQKIILTRIENNSIETINEVILKIKLINPNCVIFQKTYENLKSSEILKKCENIKKYNFKKNIMSYVKKVNRINNFESVKIDMRNLISTKDLKNKFEFISDNKYGNILRAKGILKNEKSSYYTFDYVKGEFNIKNIKWSNRNVISIIGNNLDKEKLICLFNNRKGDN